MGCGRSRGKRGSSRAGVQADLEAQSDYAKYLVVRLSGLLEQVATEIVRAHVGAQASPTVLEHVLWRMERFQNPNVERLLQLPTRSAVGKPALVHNPRNQWARSSSPNSSLSME